MKKKNIAFMFLSVAALGLAACDSGKDSSNSTTNPNVGENISVNAIRSIKDSFTSKGSMVVNYTNGYLPDVYNVYVAMDGSALETYDNNGELMQVLNVGGYQYYYVIDADNTIKYAPFYDPNTYELYPYDFNLLDAYYSSLRVTSFEMTESGTYAVTDQATRNLFASIFAATYYSFDEYGNVESMELSVKNDVVTGIIFTTSQFTINPLKKASITYELELSKLGTTTIECSLEPYATYPEAEALGNAFKALGSNVTVDLTVTVDDSKEVYSKGTAYLFDDLYYVTNSNMEYNETSTIGYIDYPGKNSLLKFTVNEGGIEATNLYEGQTIESAGFLFMAEDVAPEMFEYKDGKYVTRSPVDAQKIAPYVLVDFDESASYTSEIVVTLDADGNLDTVSYDVLFYTDNTYTYTEVHHYTLRFTSNEDKVADIEGLDNFQRNVAAFAAANVTSDIIGVWDNPDYTVEIYYGTFKINGENVSLTSISQRSLTGTIGSTTYTVTYFQSGSDEYVELKINDSKAIRLSYDYLKYFTDYLGVDKLVSPGKFALEFAMYDDSELHDYRMLYLYFAGDVTSEMVDEYADLLKATTPYAIDITDMAASEFLQDGGSKTVAEYFGMDYVLINENDGYTFVGLTTYEYSGATYFVVWIWA